MADNLRSNAMGGRSTGELAGWGHWHGLAATLDVGDKPMKLRVGKTQVEFNMLMLAAAGLIGYLWYTGKLKVPELVPTSNGGNYTTISPPDKGLPPQIDYSQYCTEPKPGDGWVCLPVFDSMPYISPTEFKWYPPGTDISDFPHPA